MRALAAGLVLFLVLAGCSTTGPPGADPSVLPKKLSASVGGPMSSSYSVEYRRGRLHYEASSPDRVKATRSDLVPSPAQWEAFWDTLEEIGIWGWRPEYLNPNVLDGTWWQVAVEYRDRTVTSRGKNNYPQAGGSNDSPEPSPDFTRFLAAVRELIGGLSFR